MFKQVRTKQGGGNRVVPIKITAQKTDILQMALGLFFPEEMSMKGPQSDFQLDVVDFKEGKLDPDVSVGELYEVTSERILRFYLSSKKLKTVDTVSSEDETQLWQLWRVWYKE